MSLSPVDPYAIHRAPPTEMDERALQLRWLAACAIARAAGHIVRQRFESRRVPLDPQFKGPQDYLTETDGEVEQFIARSLATAFPADQFVGEETGGALGQRVWIVDPIDGTADFARGVPYFCVSIAYVLDGATQIGVVYDPMRDELFSARRGHGATLNGTPLRVSSVNTMASAVVELGWSPREPFSSYVRVLTRLHELGAGVKRCGSGALGIVRVAAGRQDGYCELHINAWDAAAAILIVDEAGGWTNDFLTRECLARGNRVIACTPALRQHLESAMRV
jgi:myo-inositol-1(or 4)-monophosphatase